MAHSLASTAVIVLFTPPFGFILTSRDYLSIGVSSLFLQSHRITALQHFLILCSSKLSNWIFEQLKMNQAPLWVLLLSLLLIFQMTNSVLDEEAKISLISFLSQLSGSNSQPNPSFGWNVSSDPCNSWIGVACRKNQVTRLLLDNYNLSGFLNASLICNISSVTAEVANCKKLTGLLLGGNQLSGNLPDSLSMLGSLKELNISNNRFSRPLPGLSRISGLTMFLAQNNQLTGEIPQFDFHILEQFNVSNNNF